MQQPTDLFGARALPQRSPRYIEPRGYAGRPGTGPADETCGTCEHAARFPQFAKCFLARQRWTHGRRTDIKLRTPACDRWEPEVDTGGIA